MLVLSRKENQTISIGDDIQITVVKVQGRAIRLGIEAPEEVRILRGELAGAYDFPLESITMEPVAN